MKRRSILSFLLVGGLGLAACASRYHAYELSAGDGYSETRLSETRWRVEYAGAPLDSTELVEQRLLHRAAELTLQSGYDWFSPEDDNIMPETEIVVEANTRNEAQSAVWRPRWRQRQLSRWTDWDPRGAQPSPPVASRNGTIERYSAVADISMGAAPMPARGAFDARSLEDDARR